MSASARLSVRLQAIAQALEDTLNEAAGEPCAFVLVLQADGVAQYVSNADREDGRELIESLLARWKAGRADIPAHRYDGMDGEPGADRARLVAVRLRRRASTSRSCGRPPRSRAGTDAGRSPHASRRRG